MPPRPASPHVTKKKPADACADEILRDVPWIAATGEETLLRLAAASKLRRYGAGEPVQHRDASADHVLVVAAGRLEISVTNVEGRRLIVAYLGPGRVSSLVPVIDGRPSTYTATAHDDETAVLLIPREVFLATMRDEPALAQGVIAHLCRRARNAYNFLADSSLLPSQQRIARLLLSLHRASAGRVRGSAGFSVDLSQESLAGMLSVSRQRLNLELKSLEREGVLRLAYARIDVIDAPALARIAGE